MNPRKSRLFWFVGLYLASLAAYAAVVLAEKGALRLLH